MSYSLLNSSIPVSKRGLIRVDSPLVVEEAGCDAGRWTLHKNGRAEDDPVGVLATGEEDGKAIGRSHANDTGSGNGCHEPVFGAFSRAKEKTGQVRAGIKTAANTKSPAADLDRRVS